MTKQVLVLRKDLNMRKGKMVAQGAHASEAAILNLGVFDNEKRTFTLDMSSLPFVWEWLLSDFRKIVVGVNSEAELKEIYDLAVQAHLPAAFIVDNGLTEFGRVKTPTAVGIGPYDDAAIDAITGKLSLL